MGTKEDPPFFTRVFFINTSIVVLLFFLFAITPLVYSGYRYDEPVVNSHEEVITGSVGQDVTKKSVPSTNIVYILNETPSPDSESWRYDFRVLWPNPGKVDTSLNEQGLVLDLTSIEYKIDTALSVPLDDYDDLDFYASLSLLSGEASVGLFVRYTDYYGRNLDYLDQIQEANLTTENNSVKLSFAAPLSTLNSEVYHWVVHAFVQVVVTTTSSAKLLLHNVSAKATSLQDLFPMRIDVQSTNGSSLFANPYFKWLRDPPRINLTRHGVQDEWAIIHPMRSNDTLYVTPSNFSGYGGWRSTIRHPDQCVPVSLSLSYGDDVHWGIQLFSTRLFLSINPQLPALELDVEDNDYDPYRRFPFDSRVADFVYLPLDDEDKTYWITVSTDPIFLFSFRRISGNVFWIPLIDSSHDYFLDVDLPITSFGNLALASSDIVVLIACTLLLVLLVVRIIIHFRKLGPLIVLKDPRLVPVILLFVSAVLPWAVYTQSRMSWSGPVITAHFARINPLATYLEFYNDSLILIHPATAVVGHNLNAVWLVVGAAFLFWLPLLYCSTSIGISEDKRYDSHFAVMLMLPIVLALSSLLPGLTISSLTLGPGSYLALLALPLWLVIKTISRKVFQQREKH